MSLDTNEDLDLSKYLLFNLDNEMYATPLLNVREVIKMAIIKPVPYMVGHFKGVINLRGQIVGVVDLRVKFQLTVPAEGKGMILIVDTTEGLIGAIVDEIDSVQKIAPGDVEREPRIETKISSEFMLGVAKLGKGLVNLVDIAACLSVDELRRIKKSV